LSDNDPMYHRKNRNIRCAHGRSVGIKRRPRRKRWEKLGAAREKTREGTQEDPHTATSPV